MSLVIIKKALFQMSVQAAGSFGLSLFVVGLTVAAQTRQAQPGPVPKPLTVCELLSQPLRYDGKLVQVQGRPDGTDEGTWLVGDGCPGVFVTNGDHVWPSEIWLGTPTSTILGRTRLHNVDFEYDLKSFDMVAAKYRRLAARVPGRCIVWTYTGLFETRRDWDKARIDYPNGSTRIIGFGHLGEAPAQIILKSDDDAAVISNCRRN